jgi:type I restriction enzyme M protein
MAEIARLVDVRLPTVSNWRRRHESFPRSERRDGQEFFLVQDIIEWLDGRKIAKGDLKDGEMPGATYGGRLRRRNRQIAARPDASQQEALAQKEALWKELSRFAGLRTSPRTRTSCLPCSTSPRGTAALRDSLLPLLLTGSPIAET